MVTKVPSTLSLHGVFISSVDQDERVTPHQFSFCIFDDHKRIHLGSCARSVVSKSRYFIAFHAIRRKAEFIGLERGSILPTSHPSPPRMGVLGSAEVVLIQILLGNSGDSTFKLYLQGWLKLMCAQSSVLRTGLSARPCSSF
jgi:hypothetical protein